MCLAIALLLGPTTCKQKSVDLDPPPEAVEVPVVDEKILVSEGDSAQPAYSSDGQKLLYMSARRSNHVTSQVYERDLGTQNEKRITFQNGSTSHPRYQPNGDGIVYASTTDEEKENPSLLNLAVTKTPSKLPEFYQQTSEVYFHALVGFNIQRLSSHPGFDGEAHFSADGKSLTFTRIQNERAQILTYNLATQTTRPLTGLGENPSDYVLSLDGKASAWIDWDKTFGVSRLRLRRGKETMDVAPDMIVTKADLAFTSDSGFLIWSQKDPQTGLHGIWSFELRTNCLQHFSFRSEGDRRNPVVSPDMKWLTYTLVSRGRSKIAQVSFQQRSGPCPVIP